MRCRTWFHSSKVFATAGIVDSGKAVQQRQPRSGIERQHRLVLRMNHRQVRRQLLEHRHRRRLVVDEDAALAAGRNLAAQDDLAFLGVDAVGFQHRADGGRVGVEDRGDHRLVGAMADGVAGGFVAEQQRQRVDEDGFSGAGFAGQQVETGGELHGDVVNDRVVFDSQFQQHVSSRGCQPISRQLFSLRLHHNF